LLIDQQFGVLPYAPVLAVAFVGFFGLARSDRRLAAEIGTATIAYALVAASFHMWWGGHSAPGRLLTAIVLPLGIPSACAFARARSTAARVVMATALAVSLVITAVLIVPLQGTLILNDRDGFATWLEWLAPLVDLPRGLPSVLRDGAVVAIGDAAVWILAVAAAAFMSIRATRLRAERAGVHALLSAAALVFAIAVAATVIWWRTGVRQPTATTAQLTVVRRAARTPNGTAIKFSPFQRVSVASAVARLAIGPSQRRPLETDGADLSLTGVPAGVYRLDVRPRAGQDAAGIEARIAGTGMPIEQWSVGNARTGDLRLTIPVPVSQLDVWREPLSAAMLDVALRPLAIPRRPLEDEAKGAARYGSTTVFLIEGFAYFEATGLWLSSGRADLAAEPPARALFVRNTNHDNIVRIEASGIVETLTLRAREERVVTLPPSAEPFGLVRIDVAEGVVPAMQETGSSDYRNLGLWVAPR
jgi:hypothetical protein